MPCHCRSAVRVCSPVIPAGLRVALQTPLPFGSAEDVRAEVKHLIRTLAVDGTGYIVAPCHNLQNITPLKNIVALYEAAHEYGRLG